MKRKKESYESPEMHLFLMSVEDIITRSTGGPIEVDDKAQQDINDAEYLKGLKH